MRKLIEEKLSDYDLHRIIRDDVQAPLREVAIQLLEARTALSVVLEFITVGEWPEAQRIYKERLERKKLEVSE